MKPLSLPELKDTFRRNEAMCGAVIGMLKLVSTKARLRTMCMLMQGEYCVQDLVDVAGEGKAANMSQQLRMLRLAGAVETRRDGKQILYRLKEGPVQRLVAHLHAEYLSNETP